MWKKVIFPILSIAMLLSAQDLSKNKPQREPYYRNPHNLYRNIDQERLGKYPAQRENYILNQSNVMGYSRFDMNYPINNYPNSSYSGSNAAWVTEINGQTGDPYVSKNAFANSSDGRFSFYACSFFQPGEGSNLLLVKLDENGNEVWRTVFNSAINGDDYLENLFVSNDENIFLIATITESDFAVRPHILKYSPEGILQFNNPIENSFSPYLTYYHMGTNNRIYISNRLANGDGTGYWAVESFDESGSLLHRYESGKFDVYRLISPFITLGTDGSPLVAVEYNNTLNFYRFNENLDLQWTFDVGAEFSSDTRIDYSAHSLKIFDLQGNIYFTNNDYYVKEIFQISPQGNSGWTYKFPWPKELLGMGVDKNQNIIVVTKSDEYSPKKSFSFYTRIDSSGNAQIEEKEYLHTESMNLQLPHFSFSNTSGYYTFNNTLFDNQGNYVGITNDVRIFFAEKTLFADLTPNSIRGLNLNLATDWEYNLQLPGNNSVSLVGSVSDEKGNIINLLENSSGAQEPYSINKVGKDGNVVWTKKVLTNLVNLSYNAFFQKISAGKFIAIFESSSYQSNKTIILSLVFDENGNEINRQENEFDRLLYLYRSPVMQNQKIYWAGFYEYMGMENDLESYWSIFKVLIFNSQGQLTWKNDILSLDGDRIAYGYVLDFFVDAGSHFNILVQSATRPSPNMAYNRSNGIIEISEDLKTTFHKTDFDFPGVYYSDYANDSWGNIYCAWLTGTTETNETVVRLTKIDALGNILWERNFPANSEYRTYPYLIEVKSNGQMALFVQGTTNFSSFVTTYYLLDREGNTVANQNFGWSRIALLNISPDGNDLVITEDGINAKISFMEISTGQIHHSFTQSDLRGRIFYSKTLGFADDNSFFYVSGDRVGPAGSSSEAEVMRFDLNDSLNYTVDQKTINLSGSFPNPGNGQTAIRYTLPDNGDVEIVIYNTLGREIHRAVIYQYSGDRVFYFGDESLASGAYFYTVRQKHISASGKFLHIK